MLKSLATSSLVFGIVLATSTIAAQLPQKAIGKEYSIVRADLIKRGEIPLDQRKSPARWCGLDTRACSKYPETSDCTVDGFCRMEWETKSHKKFVVIIRQDIGPLTVLRFADPATP